MDFLEKECPVCSEKFNKDDDIVVCPKCGAPYHRECYDKNGKCIFPDLHKSKKSWREVYDSTPDEKISDDTEKSNIICPLCGEENPKDTLICRKCGQILYDSSEQSAKTPYDRLKEFMRAEDDDEDDDNDKHSENDFNFTYGGNPFIFLIDPMGGVAKNEDFNGVNGAELAKFVRANTPYYMPVFKKIKSENKSKFNFAAFFFTGGWYLYRKQYVTGAIISILYFLMVIVRYLVTAWFAADLWKEVYSAVSASGISYPGYEDIFSWAFSHNSSDELLLMMTPYMISILTFILQLVCGFAANRSYFKHCIGKISSIKKNNSGENAVKEISEKGGVNTPLAWSIMVCYLIATFAFSLL